MLNRIKASINHFQQKRPLLAFPYGVMKKFGEDRAGEQAALLAYYGFFSIFPLLLFAVTVLGMVLRNNPDLQERILTSALAQFPIIGDQIRENVNGLGNSGVALVIGLGGALWAGLAGVKALQNAMDHVWDIPIRRQPGTPARIGRGTDDARDLRCVHLPVDRPRRHRRRNRRCGHPDAHRDVPRGRSR